MRLLYTICYSLGFVLLSPVFLYKMWKRGKYKENFFQRFGRYVPEMSRKLSEKNERRCWVQAVSVGEVNLAFTFVAALRKRFPDLRVILTTTTSTGYALAKQRLPAADVGRVTSRGDGQVPVASGDAAYKASAHPMAGVELLYFPQDFPFAVRRAFNLIQPDFIVLMESELWPNHIWEAAHRSVPVFLVNARMSPRSAARHKKFRWPFCHIWPCLRPVGRVVRHLGGHRDRADAAGLVVGCVRARRAGVGGGRAGAEFQLQPAGVRGDHGASARRSAGRDELDVGDGVRAGVHRMGVLALFPYGRTAGAPARPGAIDRAYAVRPYTNPRSGVCVARSGNGRRQREGIRHISSMAGVPVGVARATDRPARPEVRDVGAVAELRDDSEWSVARPALGAETRRQLHPAIRAAGARCVAGRP
jgi:hypothetical protein